MSSILIIDIDIPNFSKRCEQIFKDGYQDPIITTKINDKVFSQPKLVFRKGESHKNIDIQKKMLMITMKNVLRSLSVSQSICDIHIKLSDEAVKFLYKSNLEKNEISGKFNIQSTSTYFTLDIDELSVQNGDKESANYIESFGTFHTHPYDAYKKYNVCIAWPSADDYFSFLYMYGLCYSGFHVVSTLEGIYLISLQKYIPPQKVMKDFEKYKKKVEYHHGIDYPETDKNCDIEKGKINHKKIDDYVNRINKIGFFNLVFVKWIDCNKPIQLNYSAIDKNCIISDEQGKFLKENQSE